MSVTEPPMQPPVPMQGQIPQGMSMRPPTSEEGASSATVNLIDGFTDSERAMIAATCCDDYDADVNSRKPRMRRCAEYQGLYASVMKAKNFPFQNAANVNLPVLTYPMLQVQGRLFDMLLPANGKLLYCSPTNLQDIHRANVTETFGNAYIRNEMPEMEQGLDDTLHQVCIYGSGFRRTYWNEFEERVASDWIPIADFVVMDTQRSQDPSMRDVPRYTLVQRLNRFDLEGWAGKGIYRNVDKIMWGEPERKETSEFEDKVKVIDGITASTESNSTDDKPRLVIEQHRKWRMPSRPNKGPQFDGQAHAVMVTIDYESGQVLRFVVREEPDPRDHARYQRQSAEHGAYTQQMEAFEAMLASPPPPQMDPMTGMPVPAPSIPPPAMPRWMKTGEDGQPMPPRAQRVREICFFTHYRAFPSEGFYGLGFGDFLVGLNKAVNTILNQHIDGATLQNAKPGMISRQMKSDRGPINMAPGVLAEVDVPMGSLKDGVMFMDIPPNDPTTMALVELLMSSADKLVASSDIMSGTSSGANRTAKETQILAEQMMMQITVLARRMKMAFRHELDKIWRCWGVFLPDEEVRSIVTEDGSPMELPIGRGMFTPDAHVTPAADPRTKTQRIDESRAVMAEVAQNPYITTLPPEIKAPMLRACTEDILRALGADKLVKLLPPIQPPPQGPPPPRPYWEEDANFLRGQDSQVNPADNDEEHLAGHRAMLERPAGQALDKQGRDMHERHIRFHEAQRINKAGQAMQPPPMGRGVPPMPMPGPQMGMP